MTPLVGRTDLRPVGLIVGLALVSVLTRCFFFLTNKAWSLPDWA